MRAEDAPKREQGKRDFGFGDMQGIVVRGLRMHVGANEELLRGFYQWAWFLRDLGVLRVQNHR
jgi:hypothetical protein